MKKYKCSGCFNKCAVSQDEHSDFIPINCLYFKDKTAFWTEITEEKEAVTDCNQLPDWCKVGEWVCYYGDGKYEYFQITKIELNRLYGKDGYFSLMCNVKPARKRPFNADEMKALVGKVMENTNITLLVNAYGKLTGDISTTCGNYTAESLMDRDFTIDGEPCYVLEHLNEKGEWVK